MTFNELGAMLREERERRGLTLDQVATRLKISVRSVRAIEDGDTNELPHAVYARGFIRAYGSLLGLDASQVFEAMDTVYPHEVKEDLVENPCVVDSPRGGGRLARVILTLALVLSGVLFAAYWYHKQKSARELMPSVAEPAPFAEPAPAQPPVPAPVTPEPSVEPQPVTQPSGGDVMPSANGTTSHAPVAIPAANGSAPVPAAPATAPVEKIKIPTPAQVAQEVAIPPSVTASEAVVPDGQHRVVLTAVAECWVHSTADGSDVRQFSLHKGQTFALAFAKTLTLKLGNAGGVQLRYDGKDLSLAGAPGQVKTIVFPPAE